MDDDSAGQRTALAAIGGAATLSGIVGVENDPTLRLAGVSVEDDAVRVKVACATGIHV